MFTKHLPICDPTFGFEFQQLIQIHLNMNLDPNMLIGKLQMLTSVFVPMNIMLFG